ncbi:MAG: tetratricopeptide repeat protein [Bacteroidia bacterium]|jgi:tetratricopeptide (TPR) repeat protein|nr:tetratricopeptide repeat protein [Bacteroidia bacterium]
MNRIILLLLAIGWCSLLRAQSGSGVPSTFYPALELITLGDVELRFGRTEQALMNYNNAIAMAPDFAEAYVHRGRLYAIMGRQMESAADFQQATQLNPYAALFIDPRRRLQMLKTDYRSSAEDPMQQILNNPYQTGLEYNLLDRSLIEGHFDSSLAASNALLKTNPLDTEALTCAALSSYFLGQTSKGHKYIDEVIALIPASAQASDIKGMMYKKEERFDEARKWFQKAIAQDSLYAISFYHLGYLSKLEGDTTAALQWFDKALRVEPQLRQALMMRSAVYNAQSNFTGAQTDLQLISDAAETDHALYNQAVLNKNLGDYQNALRLYEDLLYKNPNDVLLLNALGNLYNFFGDFDRAVLHYNRALQLKPDYHTARYNLGITLLLQLRHVRACAELREAEMNNVPGAAMAVRCNCAGF